jgi:hypothetical protein
MTAPSWTLFPLITENGEPIARSRDTLASNISMSLRHRGEFAGPAMTALNDAIKSMISRSPDGNLCVVDLPAEQIHQLWGLVQDLRKEQHGNANGLRVFHVPPRRRPRKTHDPEPERKRTPPPDVIAMYDDYLGGLSVPEIAERRGIGANSVYAAFRKHGLRLRCRQRAELAERRAQAVAAALRVGMPVTATVSRHEREATVTAIDGTQVTVAFQVKSGRWSSARIDAGRVEHALTKVVAARTAETLTELFTPRRPPSKLIDPADLAEVRRALGVIQKFLEKLGGSVMTMRLPGRPRG